MKNTSLIREQFNRQAPAYARMPVVSDPRILKFLVELSGVGERDRVLDVACGPGFMAMAFAEKARRAIGVDITDSFIEGARAEAARRGLRNVLFHAGDGEGLAYRDEAFDIVLCKFAFHHFPHPEGVLAEMRRVMKPEGKIILVDMLTSEDPAKSAYHNRIERLCDPSHSRALSESDFARIFAAQGLSVTFKRKGQRRESVTEWMRHASPPPERAREIIELLRASIRSDRSGLKVEMEGGEIFLTHRGVSYVLRSKVGLTL